MNGDCFETIFWGDVVNCVKSKDGVEYNLQEIIEILNDHCKKIVCLENSLDEKNVEIERLEKIIKLTSYQLEVQDRIIKEIEKNDG